MLEMRKKVSGESMLDQLDEEKSTILIVDDEINTLDLLEAVLSSLDYNIITTQHGEEALKIVEDNDIDLVILDIMMPGMNGFEVCKKLKSDKKTSRIPVLVITALSSLESNIEVLEVGAEGYLSKPFNNQLVIAYVRSLIKMKHLSDEVIKLDHMKDDLTRMIIHDLRNPLISALGFINLSLKEENKQKSEWYAQVIKNSVTDAFNLMENLHDIIKLESNKLKLTSINNENIYLIISEIIDSMIPAFKKRGLRAKLDSKCNLTHNVDPSLFKRVIQNILANAAKFAEEDSEIIIRSYNKEGALRIEVSNKGDVIPEEHWNKIFKKFGQVELKKRGENVGVGLGLAFCKLAIEAHNGTIWVDSPALEFDDGSSFIFEIK